MQWINDYKQTNTKNFATMLISGVTKTCQFLAGLISSTSKCQREVKPAGQYCQHPPYYVPLRFRYNAHWNHKAVIYSARATNFSLTKIITIQAFQKKLKAVVGRYLKRKQNQDAWLPWTKTPENKRNVIHVRW